MTDPAERLAEAGRLYASSHRHTHDGSLCYLCAALAAFDAAAPRRAAEQAVLRTAIVLWEYEWTGSKPGGGWEAAYVAHMDAIGRYAHEVHTSD